MTNGKRPVCGMEVDEKKSKFKTIKNDKEYYFCSAGCREKFLESKIIESSKLIPGLLVITLITLSILSFIYDFMPRFMGIFFIIVSLLKMADWKGFVDSFSMYDVISKKFRAYGWAYPAIEFLLGIFFLFNFNIKTAAWATLIIMSVGSVGVAQNLLSKNPVKCACLGTLINIPLTKFTLFEDILMAIMAILVLLI